MMTEGMAMKKMLFVMNPYSGIRRANRYLADIISIFNCGGYEVTAHMTAGQGDAIRVVQEKAKDMARRIIKIEEDFEKALREYL